MAKGLSKKISNVDLLLVNDMPVVNTIILGDVYAKFKHKSKKNEYTSIIFSLLFIVAGVFLLLKPETAINIVCYVLGLILISWGVVSIIQFFSDKDSTSYLSISFIFGAFVCWGL